MPEDEEKKISAIIPMSVFEKIEGYAAERGPKYPYSEIIKEALRDYIQKREDPEQQYEDLKNMVLQDPDFLKPLIADEVKQQLQLELRRILGQQ